MNARIDYAAADGRKNKKKDKTLLSCRLAGFFRTASPWNHIKSVPGFQRLLYCRPQYGREWKSAACHVWNRAERVSKRRFIFRWLEVVMSSKRSTEAANNKISFNYKADTVRIYKDAIKSPGTPKYVRFMINPDYKRLYIQGSDTGDKNTFPVSERDEKSCFVPHGRYFIRKISLLAGWSLDNSWRFSCRIQSGSIRSEGCDAYKWCFGLTRVTVKVSEMRWLPVRWTNKIPAQTFGMHRVSFYTLKQITFIQISDISPLV